jgi:TRAP-type C4-dicarboxylate transport system substrate-binding protein
MKKTNPSISIVTYKVIAAIFLSVLGGGVSAQTIKLASIAPEGSPWNDALVDLGHRWKESTGGKVKLRIYPGGVAGDEPDMLRKMRIGQLHAAAVTTLGLISLVPDIEAITFPMQIRTDEELQAVIKSVGPNIEEQLGEKGYRILGWSMAGWIHFFSRNKVETADDLRKQKLFFWGSDTVYVGLLKTLGFQPVALPVTDLLPSLQTGLVDAFAAPPVGALSFQWFALAKNMSTLRWQPTPTVIVIREKQWNKIPEKFRADLETAAREVNDGLWAKSRELEQQSIDAMIEHGLQVHEAADSVRDEFKTMVDEQGLPIFLEKRFSPEFFKKVQAALADYRSKSETSDR